VSCDRPEYQPIMSQLRLRLTGRGSIDPVISGSMTLLSGMATERGTMTESSSAVMRSFCVCLPRKSGEL
jgi:hypothetical protein